MSTAEKRTLETSSNEVNTPVVLLDIEGTTTSINFVKDTLFTYVRSNLEKYVKDHWNDDEFKAVFEKLIEQSTADVEEKLEGAVALKKDEDDLEKAQQSLVANILWQMDNDRKAGPLKQLQGYIYREGYEKGDLKGHVYEDVVPAMKAWKAAEKQIYIYSSGSTEAQKLLFKHTTEGDLLEFIAGHFDTEIGAKQDAKSYSNIAEKIEKKTNDITFFTDVVKEAEAAKEAGLRVVLVEREGNDPLLEEVRSAYTVVKTLTPEVGEEVAAKKPKIVEEASDKDTEMTEVAESTEKETTKEETKAAPVPEVTEEKEEEKTEAKSEEKTEAKSEEKTEAKSEETTEEKLEEKTEVQPEEKKDEEEKMDTDEKIDTEKEEVTEKSDKNGDTAAEKPHENGVNGNEDGETNGIEHTNGVEHSNGEAAKGEEEAPKEASPVKKVVSDAAGDAAESVVAE